MWLRGAATGAAPATRFFHTKAGAVGRCGSTHIPNAKREFSIMKRAIIVAVAFVAFTLVVHSNLAAAQPGANQPGSKTLSIYSANPAYFESPDGKPVVMIGDYEASPICPTGVPMDPNYDYRVFFDTLKDNGLNFAKVWIFYGVEAEYDSETPFDDYHRFNLLPYLRSGAGACQRRQAEIRSYPVQPLLLRADGGRLRRGARTRCLRAPGPHRWLDLQSPGALEIPRLQY